MEAGLLMAAMRVRLPKRPAYWRGTRLPGLVGLCPDFEQSIIEQPAIGVLSPVSLQLTVI